MAPTFNVIGIVVADMAASLGFYRRLGLDIAADVDGESHVEAVLPGGLRIAWDSVDVIRSFDPDWFPPVGGTRVSLAFECASPTEVDRTYAELVAAGYRGHRAPWNAFWGQRYAVILDPDGTGVDLYAPLPS